MTNIEAQRAQYNRDAVLSASPVRLLTMLYDRLMLDLERAEAGHPRADWQLVSDNLLHAQAIVAELASSLKTDVWDGGETLLALYNYVSNALVAANVQRDVAGIRESIALLEPLRQGWHEAAGRLTAQPVGSESANGRALGVA
ncbi:MAG TPA: flagellar export chaperone FliS [Marisediminicola sp.]|jgi:flagellar protein FliS|nr:flagellar export chaperone FliS [Marisediminicola sp.]